MGAIRINGRRGSTIAAGIAGAAMAISLVGCASSGPPTSKPKPTHATSAPTAPALPGHLAWALEQGDDPIVYTSNSDGSNAKPLGKAQHGEQPHWSPDGTKIAIVTSAKSGGGIVGSVANADGSGQVIFSIPAGDPNLACAVWSPDATKLACEGFDDSHPSIEGAYVVNSSDGTDVTRLTSGLDVPCAYSPDGTQLLFLRRNGSDDEHNALMTVNIATQALSTVIPSTVGLSCDWSPDGKTILSVTDGALLLIDVATKKITTITIPVHSGRGAFSPDGTHIIFSRGTGDHQSDIWTTNLQGTDLVRITFTTTVDEEFGDWGK
jgi:Tol biopolymer transport system component